MGRRADQEWTLTSVASEIVLPLVVALLLYFVLHDMPATGRFVVTGLVAAFGPTSLLISRFVPEPARAFAEVAAQVLLVGGCANVAPEVWHPSAAVSIGLLTIAVVIESNRNLAVLSLLSAGGLVAGALRPDVAPTYWHVTLVAGFAVFLGSVLWFRGWEQSRAELTRSHDELLHRVRAFSWTASSDRGELLTIAGSVEGVLGYQAEDLLGLTLDELFVELRNWTEGDEVHSVQMARHSDGHTVTLHEVRLAATDPAIRRGVSTDITEADQATEALRYQAEHDSLTGLYNRQTIRLRANQAMGSTDATALIVVDLDRFKNVNDTLGHATGDQLLKILSKRLMAAFHWRATVARIGGDEFALLIPGADLAEATDIAEQVAALAANPTQIDGFALSTSASIGVAVAPHHGSSYDDLLRAADIASYAAKGEGGGVRVFSSVPDQLSRRRLRLLSEMSAGIDAGEFELFLQPKVRLEDGQVVGAEGLARWRHSEFGLLLPAEFLHAIEVASDHLKFATEMIQQAIDVLASLGSNSDIHVAVNLGSMSLRDGGLPDRVAGMLQMAGVAGSSLLFEIIESDLVQGDPVQSTVIAKLQGLGIRISIDDFGTGYSNFGQLKSLTADEIKIDRSLIAGLAARDHDAVIVESIIELTRRLGYVVVAEGVEDEEQASLLRTLGCDVAQGFFFAQPLSQGDFMQQYVAGNLLS